MVTTPIQVPSSQASLLEAINVYLPQTSAIRDVMLHSFDKHDPVQWPGLVHIKDSIIKVWTHSHFVFSDGKRAADLFLCNISRPFSRGWRILHIPLVELITNIIYQCLSTEYNKLVIPTKSLGDRRRDCDGSNDLLSGIEKFSAHMADDSTCSDAHSCPD